MLIVDNLRVKRGRHEFHFSLELSAGEIVALQGRSGIGKTTLLETIAGYVNPDSGALSWQDLSLLPLLVEERPISMLFQDYNFFEHISVAQNLGLGFRGGIPERAMKAASAELQVDDQWEKMPPQLSGGQRQRVALIHCLLRPEPLCLLDEPFAELDDHNRDRSIRWCSRIARETGKTVLLVTHQDEDVRKLADRRIELCSAA